MGTCDTCRFAQEGGRCEVGICAMRRCEMIAKGMGIPVTECVQAGPEPMTPDGLIGFRVGAYEYPPTIEGYRDATAQLGRLEQYKAVDVDPVARFDKALPSGPVWVWQGTELVPVVLWTKGAMA